MQILCSALVTGYTLWLLSLYSNSGSATTPCQTFLKETGGKAAMLTMCSRILLSLRREVVTGRHVLANKNAIPERI